MGAMIKGITRHFLATLEGRILVWCILVNRPGSLFHSLTCLRDHPKMQVFSEIGARDIGKLLRCSLILNAKEDGCMHTSGPHC